MPPKFRNLIAGVLLSLFAASAAAAQDWTPTSTTGTPPGFRNASGVWTGKYMLVWGGLDAVGNHTNTGARYDPATDSWTPLSTTGAPPPRQYHSAVWTGTQMIVWGGEGVLGGLLNTGGVYDLASDTWTVTTTTGAPSARDYHSAVWTGSLMVIWGGTDGTLPEFNSGGRYDPVANTWTATTLTGAPVGRALHSTVWTGSEMIVWGGNTNGTGTATALSSGGRYSPVSDSWVPTTLIGAPSARYYHLGVWTGARMMIWGGTDPASPDLLASTGCLYDPATDLWTVTSLTAAPDPRASPGVVWADTEVIVWGGDGASPNTIQGGRYDPGRDEWTPVSIVGAPTAIEGFVSVWTGTQMIIWGGDGIGATGPVGGLYTPPVLTALKANGSCTAAASIPAGGPASAIALGLLGTLFLILRGR